MLPAARGPPFGVTFLDLPARFPLPAKISIRVGKPIHLTERIGPNADPAEGHKLITSTGQRTLTRLSNQRSLPILG